MRKPIEDPLSVINSEASEVSLRILAASPVATRLLEGGLFSGSDQGKNVEERTIPFDKIGQTFTLASLVMFEITHLLLLLLLLLLFSCSIYSVSNSFLYLPLYFAGWRACQEQVGVVVVHGTPWWTDVLCGQESTTNSKLGGCRAVWKRYSAQASSHAGGCEWRV